MLLWLQATSLPDCYSNCFLNVFFCPFFLFSTEEPSPNTPVAGCLPWAGSLERCVLNDPMCRTQCVLPWDNSCLEMGPFNLGCNWSHHFLPPSRGLYPILVKSIVWGFWARDRYQNPETLSSRSDKGQSGKNQNNLPSQWGRGQFILVNNEE